MPIAASSTGGSFTVLSTTDAGTHLRVTSTSEASYIGSLVSLAVEYVENVTGRSLANKKYTWKLDRFPDRYVLFCPKPPLAYSTAVASITYIDTDGSTDTWGSTYYTVDAHSVPARITPAYQETWPITLNVPNAVTITFDAGYTSSSLVPHSLLHAVRFITAHYWANRQEVVSSPGFVPMQVPKNSDWLMAPYIVPFFEGY
jgi:uncharacterized phiE125 gp8 family phage protein